jgi:sulfite exporter TauE/SafE/copper chaperone CopZ
MLNKKTIYISGMHCASCEKLLDSEFRNISGVVDVKISRSKGEAEIYFDGEEPRFEEFSNIAEKYGYGIVESIKYKGKRLTAGGTYNERRGFKVLWKDWVWSAIIVAIIIFLFDKIQSLEIFRGARINQEEIGYGVAILIGVVASLSSCLAVVGALVISFAEKYKSKNGNFYNSAIRPNLFFQIGRLATFFLLGGVLGLAGGQFNPPSNFIGIFTIIIALVMAWLGLNILGLLPSISNSGLRVPSELTKHWDKLKNSNHRAAPFLLGGLSFFLPCGFTQSMQLFALGSGSFFTGAMVMFLFSLGTTPVLLLLGITASGTKENKFGVFKKAAGLLVIIFAVYTFNSGLALTGFKEKTDINLSPVKINENENFQEARMNITSRGFEPNVINIKKGVPIKWIINGDGATNCTSRIIVPSLGIEAKINPGDNVVELKIDQAGEVPFSCWMGMVRGKFIVE